MQAFVNPIPLNPKPSVRLRRQCPRQLTVTPRAAALLQETAPSPSPAEWLRKNEAALPRRDNVMLANAVSPDPVRSTTRGLSGGLYLSGGQQWLYTTPPAYCNIGSGVEELMDFLKKRVFYLGPVTRNKVVCAVRLAREAVGVSNATLLQNITIALIVADLQMDCDTVCAAVLRGIVSKPGCTKKDVEKHVGADVLQILKHHQNIVESVNLCVDYSFTEMSFSNLRELILVDALEEHRAISLELACAILYMRTVDMLDNEESKRAVARKAMYLYAPLANQLGIWFIQGELEELAFMYLQPESYHMVRHLVRERRRECESTLAQAKEVLERILTITPEVRSLVRTVLIKGRVKGLYSVYRKMRRSGKKVYEIYDILALRVVIQPKRADEQSEEAACYAVAEVIKQYYETFSSRAKDYIAQPKRNGYRSVHLTVVPQDSTTPLEIQIRSEKMHHVAEFGAAAHWIYKEDSAKETSAENSPALREEKDVSTAEELAAYTGLNFAATTAQRVHSRPRIRSDSNMNLVGVARRVGRDDVQEQMRKGYVTCLASAIRASRVIVAAAGQLYGLAVGSTLLDLAAGMGIAEGIAMVNGSVAPLTQRLEMSDIVRFIQALPEA